MDRDDTAGTWIAFADTLDRIVRAAVRVASVVVILIAFFITIAMTAGVILRFAFNRSLLWTDEVAALLLASMMFVVIGIGIHERSHIGVNFLLQRLPAVGRRVADILIHLVSAGFFLLVGVQGYRVALSGMSIDLAMVPLPRGVFHFFMPVGCALAILACINNIVRALAGHEVKLSGGSD